MMALVTISQYKLRTLYLMIDFGAPLKICHSLFVCRDLYLGQLYPNEDYRIFGYVTNTKIKFVVLESVNHPIKVN